MSIGCHRKVISSIDYLSHFGSFCFAFILPFCLFVCSFVCGLERSWPRQVTLAVVAHGLLYSIGLSFKPETIYLMLDWLTYVFRTLDWLTYFSNFDSALSMTQFFASSALSWLMCVSYSRWCFFLSSDAIYTPADVQTALNLFRFW